MVKTIALCASASFYEHVNEVADALEQQGFVALVPLTARTMRRENDYDVAKKKTWYDNPDDFDKKTYYLDKHIAEVAAADAVLVVNDDKKNIKGYIGFNVMIEMAVAYYLKKPIFVLHGVPKANPAYEEVTGMQCIIIDGDLSKIRL